jgi:hypothetical protein
MARLDDSERQLKELWQKELKGDFNINNLKEVVDKVFNALIVISEADNYYRDRMIDYHMIVCAMHEKVKERSGADYWQKYLEQRNKQNTQIREMMKQNAKEGIPPHLTRRK